MFRPKKPTSWNHEARWYNELVDVKGQYFHEHVIIPKSLQLLDLKPDSTLLELACGNGILARYLPKAVTYYGIDAAPKLIQFAKNKDKNPRHHFVVSDVTQSLALTTNFTHATVILALQNIKDATNVITNATRFLKPKGKLLIVLNHPCFRIPRQSSWEIDPQNKLQYRRINRYLSPLEIPINMHPGQIGKSITWTFHLPISAYSEMITNNGFMIEKLAEWTSDKISVGSAAKMENRSRSEFPLFLALLCHKN